MTRAITALSGSAARLPRPLIAIGQFLLAFWQEVSRDPVQPYQPERRWPYRPERHYMRGPGPAWRAKHGQTLPQ